MACRLDFGGCLPFVWNVFRASSSAGYCFCRPISVHFSDSSACGFGRGWLSSQMIWNIFWIDNKLSEILQELRTAWSKACCLFHKPSMWPTSSLHQNDKTISRLAPFFWAKPYSTLQKLMKSCLDLHTLEVWNVHIWMQWLYFPLSHLSAAAHHQKAIRTFVKCYDTNHCVDETGQKACSSMWWRERQVTKLSNQLLRTAKHNEKC